jgi:hypothetical protein
MKIAVWEWQFSKDYPGAIGGDDAALPIAEVWGKTNDGLTYQGRFDDHPAEISGIAAVLKAERDIYGKQGIEYVPWGVVHGKMPGVPDQARREGELAGAIAKAAAGPGEPARYIVDLEPYYHGGDTPQFWRNDLGAGAADVKAFLAAFVAAGGQEIWVAPDARTPHLEPVAFATWAASPVVKMIAPQVYFTDFKKPAKVALDAALFALAAYRVGPEKVHPVFPGDADPAALLESVAYAHERGCAGFSVWRRGSIRADSLKALGALADPWEAAPPPVVDVEGVRRHLDTIDAEIAAVRRLVGSP